MANTPNLTAAEEAKIQQAIQESKQKEQQALIETEIRNRIPDAQRMQPGYTGY